MRYQCDAVGDGASGAAGLPVPESAEFAMRPFPHRLLVALSLLLPLPTAALAQGAVGALRGTVRAAPSDAPLPYAVVAIPSLQVERFSGAAGDFFLGALPVGEYDVSVKRLGFVPQRVRVRITAGATTPLEVRLLQVPVRLANVQVRPTEPCLSPGLPDSTRFPEVAQLVGLLRENADRFRLLATQYPFSFLQVRAQGRLGAAAMIVDRVDTLRIESSTRAGYRPGRVVVDQYLGNRRETVMAIPTIIDITDERFVESHCFRYAGTSTRGGETWVQLDVRAADAIRSPDVNGSFHLDSATAQLRKMELELSRPDRLPRGLRDIRSVRVITSFLDIAPGLSIIDVICGVNWLKSARGKETRPPMELQQVLAYAFRQPPPDVAPSRELSLPRWRPMGRVERETLSCATEPE